MMKAIANTILIAAAFCVATLVHAEERASAEEAVAMVHKVIASIKADGKEKIIAEINAFSPEFRRVSI